MTKTCPKCAYTRTAEDQHVHAGICPSCGIAYNKWVQPEVSQNREKDVVHEEFELHIKPSTTLRARALETLLYVPEKTDPLSFYGRAITLGFFALWGISFILTGIDWKAINGSFMHNINLPFHEFGHVLFAPFGRFMQILGGSLFQILMPLGIGHVY